MIKAIIFDLGGVLVDLDMDRCIAAFKENLGFDGITEILDKCHQKGVFRQMEEGSIGADGFRRAVLEQSRPGSREEDVDASLCQLLTTMDPRKGPLLNELASKYTLFSLSNNNPIAMKRIREILAEGGVDYYKVFNDEFISYQMKMMKPSAEIYLEAVRRTGFNADELLFVDDSLSNVEGARRCGINAVLYEEGSDLAACIYGAIAAL